MCGNKYIYILYTFCIYITDHQWSVTVFVWSIGHRFLNSVVICGRILCIPPWQKRESTRKRALAHWNDSTFCRN